ncbi:cytochrome P450 307a1-like [Anoplophora glabripennis]|uniref:cytochrome P450 307a1-like n=1 Tax=Anoplophora glabripennis TaxID=217634 RepID=UPI00087521BA|nr:cytochrome P450 307a1-like [Anoplophora glabripennis]
MLALVCYEIYKKNKDTKALCVEDGLKEPPTPRKMPIIGHLHLLGGYEVPYQAFSFLGKKYGNVVKLQLGQVKCVVVNDQKNIREALVTKGHHFDSRPNFQRYKELFSGNKENSLAFCDWSETQKTRRDLLKAYTFPRAFSNKFASLETLISSSTRTLISQIIPEKTVELKPLILRSCANIFLNHFCSKNFEIDDERFVRMVEDFDEIFYEVNQGYAADFLPFLMPFLKKNLGRMNALTHRIRSFVEDKVVENRYEEFDLETDPGDYIESFIKYVKSGDGPELPWDTALFALEDIIGGHSAVGNFLMKLFGFLVELPDVQRKIQEEIDAVVGTARDVTIADRGSMPYVEGVIFEAIRLIASPIVPRVANQDSSIDGYKIEQGTVLFLNNYDLSMSDRLWDRPEEFLPERFLKDNRLIKPDHFLPFGGGRRSCMGYKMVQLVSFGILGGFLQKYTILPAENESYKVPIGSLALAKDTFKFRFVRR